MLLRDGEALLLGVIALVLVGVLLRGVTVLLGVVARLTLPVVLPPCTTPPLLLPLTVPLVPVELAVVLGLLVCGLATRPSPIVPLYTCPVVPPLLVVGLLL